MDKIIVGLLGAVSALALAGPSLAAPVGPRELSSAMAASTYSDMLKPAPNAQALSDTAATTDSDDQADEAGFDPQAVEQAQYYHHRYWHHHHWHRHWWHRRPVVVINPP